MDPYVWRSSDSIFSLPLHIQATLPNASNHFVDVGNQFVFIPDRQRYRVVRDVLTAIETENFMIRKKRSRNRMTAGHADCQIVIPVERQMFQAIVDVVAYEK